MAKQGDATDKMPQTAQGESGQINAPKNTNTAVDYQQRLFMSMALGMSWQLALVVIVPIVGGHVLDEHYHKTPLITLSGLAVAVIGVFGVLHRTVTEANLRANGADSKGKKQ